MAGILVLIMTASTGPATASTPVWPSPPDEPRIEFVQEIRCADLKLQSGFLSSVLRVVGGASDEARLQLPFDIVLVGQRIFATCQQVPALVEIDPASKRFRLHKCDDVPFANPLSLCADGDIVYVTDSANGVVYRFDGDTVEPFITEGLVRPTGIARLSGSSWLYVVDTGSHRVEVFDSKGKPVESLGMRGTEEAGFNYPTFAAAWNDVLIVNDTLNYKIKLFSAERMVGAIGEEGDGPGAFARPKGVAVDDEGHIYVVDGLFDNVQVFDTRGQLLLVVGSAGAAPGQFWSPAGIDVAGDLIYIADTFNHRIQVLRRLDG